LKRDFRSRIWYVEDVHGTVQPRCISWSTFSGMRTRC
jgi:hypothetical protein